MATTPPPEVPRGLLTPEALGLWFTRFSAWSKEMAARTLALEGVTSSGVGDGAALHSFMHQGGSGWSSWRVAGAHTVQNAVGVALTANQLRAVPFVAPKGATLLTALGFEVTLGLAGNARCGLYTNKADGNLYPDKLLADGGGFTTNAAAVKNVTGLAVPLVAGELYWLAHVQDAAPSIRCLTTPTDVLGHSNDALGNIWVDLRVAFTYAALPAAFPAGALPDTNSGTTTTSVPSLYFKVAA
jgi:hypothetical protein